jgi:uncharacterized membrane protein
MAVQMSVDQSARPESGPLAWLARNLAAGGADPRTWRGAGRFLLAAVMIALGIRGLVVGDFAGTWQRIPIAHLPGRAVFSDLCAIIELASGIGLLLKPWRRIAAAILSVHLLLWVVLLKLPAVVVVPGMEATWLGFGEIAVILAGAWSLFATAGEPRTRFGAALDGVNGVRGARLLFAVSLPMIGLSHFFYTMETVSFVPAWLPWRVAWAWLTGAGNIAAACALVLAFVPRLAATLEAAMLSVITLLVWLPGVVTAPGDASWTPFLMSTAIACGAWVVADSCRGLPWLSGVRWRPRSPAGAGADRVG